MRFTKGHNQSVRHQPVSHFTGGDSDADCSGERDVTMALLSGRGNAEPFSSAGFGVLSPQMIKKLKRQVNQDGKPLKVNIIGTRKLKNSSQSIRRF